MYSFWEKENSNKHTRGSRYQFSSYIFWKNLKTTFALNIFCLIEALAIRCNIGKCLMNRSWNVEKYWSRRKYHQVGTYVMYLIKYVNGGESGCFATTGCSRWIGDILKSYRGFIFGARYFSPIFLWWKKNF